jgi:hypothetical protein
MKMYYFIKSKTMLLFFMLFQFIFLLFLIGFILVFCHLFGIERKKTVKLLSIFSVSIFTFLGFINYWNSKKILKVKDFYGEYVIDKSMFKGKQADWQYNHYRFEITEQNEFLFHETESENILKSQTGQVIFLENYKSKRFSLKIKPSNHILIENPTIYRKAHGFYIVFHSQKFGNMFFRKGKWE